MTRHWKYISAYHGSWLSLPIEVLECIAMQNWSTPAPRTIEPGVLFDVLKIRKLVDSASEDAVRASNGTVSIGSKLSRDHSSLTGDPGGSMSKQRALKVRQKACKSLHEAFEIDEIATSVASMASTSILEDVAQHVLRRDPQDLHATYVHFFHEKIPSRALIENTTLSVLDELIRKLPFEAQVAPLRTRASIQAYKADYTSTIADLGTALRILADTCRSHKSGNQQIEVASILKKQSLHIPINGNRVAQLKDGDQPSGLELQLLFGRAAAYLNLAVQSIDEALDGLSEYLRKEEEGKLAFEDVAIHQRHLESRRQVKTNAKRALKDLHAFLAKLEYSPGLPDWAQDIISQRTEEAIVKRQSSADCSMQIKQSDLAITISKSNSERQTELPPIMVYPISMLFTEKAPTDLPPFFMSAKRNTTSADSWNTHEASIGLESVTFHPLLVEAIHLLLIAHTLLQTSPAELRRHAQNVVRVCNLADGAPFFQDARWPARVDWAEVLRGGKDWIHLGSSWDDFVQPWSTKLDSRPKTLQGAENSKSISNGKHNGVSEAASRTIMDILSDERVVDDKTFQQALQAQKAKLARMEAADGCGAAKAAPEIAFADQNQDLNFDQASSPKFDSICTDRAHLVVRWLREAPQSLGGSRKKRPANKKKQMTESDVTTLTDSVTSLIISNGNDVAD